MSSTLPLADVPVSLIIIKVWVKGRRKIIKVAMKNLLN